MSSSGWPIDQASIAAIAAMPQSGDRNRLITQTYHELALAIGRLTGRPGANWFHYGTWASNTAGRIMTGATLPPIVRRVLVGKGQLLGDGEHRFGLIDRLEDTGVRVAKGLSEGNVTVFAEIGAAGAAFVAAHTAASKPEQAVGRADLERIVKDALPVFGQPQLAAGYAAYEAALVESDPSKHAQLMLAGSVAMGAVEQSRLDPYVDAVMCAAVTSAFEPFADRLEHTALGRVGALRWLGRRLTTAADRAWDKLMTRYFMVFEGPGERLRLGRDVPPLPGQPLIAPAFVRPSAPALVDVIAEFDSTHGTGLGNATVDWADLRERMCWIYWFFMSRYFDPRLAEPPFSPADVQKLRALIPA